MFNRNETGLSSSHNYTNLTTSENATKVESLNTTSINDIEFHAQAKVWQPYEFVSLVLATCSISVCVLVITLAFKKNGKTFFKWKRAQRFVVMTSTCDILFYGVQLIYNINVTVSGRVPPPAICSIYAVFLLEFAYAQCNLGGIAAATACYYILKQAELDLGKYDWKMFSYMFVYPAIILVTASLNGGMGHNGL
ncbi:unnamed protein product [Mytilus coruscus]|uniref:G-protein coupled receptors family 1 profile domain-containing protein n=1 Tax=Mytilus coruscus TaxID=42192 RepID=A0A6J8B256_MYTCO|nr:unnamed protein product [Mytilus coruscus]